MDDSAEVRRPKDRSPFFPFITLEVALERAKQVYAQERRSVVPYLRLVKHWQYTEKSSGALQTIAALKQYGLLKELGGSALARQFQLTDLVFRILVDQRPDTSERDKLLREAALLPPISAEVHSQWGGELPNESTLIHFLVVEKGFLDSAAPKVAKILQENHRFAKVVSENGYEEPSGERMIGSVEQVEQSPTPAATPHPMPLRLPAYGGGVPAASAHVENVRLPSGTWVTMSFSAEPDLKTIKQLHSFLKWKLDVLAEEEASGN